MRRDAIARMQVFVYRFRNTPPSLGRATATVDSREEGAWMHVAWTDVEVGDLVKVIDSTSGWLAGWLAG